MPTIAEIEIDHECHRDLIIAQNLGRQLAADDCSDTEVWETISEAFPDVDLQTYALHAVLCERIMIEAHRTHRLQRLQSWRDR